MYDPNEATPRRDFLGQLAAAAAVPLAASTLIGAATAGAQAVSASPHKGPDNSWLDALKAKHKTVFDVETHKNGNALVQAKNFRDAWRDVYNVPEKDVNLVLAVRGTGIPIVLSDEVWAKYKLGENYGITDPVTKQPALRNPFIAANVQPGGLVTAEQTLEALMKRDVRFMVCMNTVAGATRKLVAAGVGTTEQVRSGILAGILPGVVTVPAMVIAFTMMAERGVAYVYAG